MKALTLYQPWASLVALGTKTIETRSWATNYRGPLAIHASAQKPFEDQVVGDFEIHEMADRSWAAKWGPGFVSLPLGAVLAVATLRNCVPMVESLPATNHEGACLLVDHALIQYDGSRYSALWRNVEDQRPYGDFTPGRYAWLLSNIRPLPAAVSAKGHQRLWNWEG